MRRGRARLGRRTRRPLLADRLERDRHHEDAKPEPEAYARLE